MIYLTYHYSSILHEGISTARHALRIGNHDHAGIEIDLIHNIPNLIAGLHNKFTYTIEQHLHFIRIEYPRYLEQIDSLDQKGLSEQSRDKYSESIKVISHILKLDNLDLPPSI